MMKKLQKGVLIGTMAACLSAGSVQAGNQNWVPTLLSSAVSLGGTVYQMWGSWASTVWMMGVNIDPAQIALEYMVLKEMKKTNYEWKPKPEKSYEGAAKNNSSCQDGGSDNPAGDFKSVTKNEAFPFQVAVLQNVGIESVGVGADLSALVSETARAAVLNGLAYLKPSDGSTGGDNSSAGAGSCNAGYSVCLNEMTEEERQTVSDTQVRNEQSFGTAGVARAELALKTVQQAIADDGGKSNVANSAAEEAGVDTGALQGTKITKVQNLSKLIGTGQNTTSAMKIVALMNLELAQRLNLGNMLQGSTLTVEAARAFKQITAFTE